MEFQFYLSWRLEKLIQFSRIILSKKYYSIGNSPTKKDKSISNFWANIITLFFRIVLLYCFHFDRSRDKAVAGH